MTRMDQFETNRETLQKKHRTEKDAAEERGLAKGGDLLRGRETRGGCSCDGCFPKSVFQPSVRMLTRAHSFEFRFARSASSSMPLVAKKAAMLLAPKGSVTSHCCSPGLVAQMIPAEKWALTMCCLSTGRCCKGSVS